MQTDANLKCQFTPGRLARTLGEPLWRINHILGSRQIEPLGRIGITRIYGPAAVEQVRDELAAIDARKAKAGAR